LYIKNLQILFIYYLKIFSDIKSISLLIIFISKFNWVKLNIFIIPAACKMIYFLIRFQLFYQISCNISVSPLNISIRILSTLKSWIFQHMSNCWIHFVDNFEFHIYIFLFVFFKFYLSFTISRQFTAWWIGNEYSRGSVFVNRFQQR